MYKEKENKSQKRSILKVKFYKAVILTLNAGVAQTVKTGSSFIPSSSLWNWTPVMVILVTYCEPEQKMDCKL